MADKALLRFSLVITPMRCAPTTQSSAAGQEGSGPISVMASARPPTVEEKTRPSFSWQPGSRRRS
eukprot:1002946-Prymnesium_polylepis.1